MKGCLFATLTLAMAIAAPYSQAEMIPGLIHFFKTKDPETHADAFGLMVGPNRTLQEDPQVDFRYTYAKPKSLISFLRFERILTPSTGGVLLEFPMVVFLANKGTVLTSATVEAGLASGQFKPFRYDGPKVPIAPATVQRDFWVAMAIRDGWLHTTAPFVTFKWAHIRFNALGMPEMVDSITAFHEPGLVVGEKTPCQAKACLEATAH